MKPLLPEQLFETLGTSPAGLSWEEARRRLSRYGPNTLVAERKKWRNLRRFLRHLSDPLSLLLIIATVLSLAIGSTQLGLAILALTAFNATLNTLQEWRAEKALEKLRAWMPSYAKVLRDGKPALVHTSEIVPGDVIIVEEGDKVPADAVLIEAHDLWVSNIPLTGESVPQPKFTDNLEEEYSSYFEMPNVVLAGTTVVRGSGKAVVFATGPRTVFGGVVKLTGEVGEEESPLEREISSLARHTFAIAMTVGFVFFLLSLVWLHQSIYDSMLFMIGVMTSLVPEGLQITVSMALALAVLDMVKRNVLVKRLSTVQALGSVTVIATDKTGTLTKGEMMVSRVWVYDRDYEVTGQGYEPFGEFLLNGQRAESRDPVLEKLLVAASLSSSSYLQPPREGERGWRVIGDPTDGAIIVAALKYGIDREKLLDEFRLEYRKPLDPVKKTMYSVYARGGKKYLFLKGAPRGVLNSSAYIMVDGSVEPMSDGIRARIEEKIHEFGEAGLRVIGVAFGEGTESDSELIFLGLIGIMDPPRPEVPEFVAKAKRGKIKIVVLTGDYGPTAKAIAKKVGVVGESARVIRGVDLEKMSDEELSRVLREGEVIFSRVTPEQKLRILRVLKKNGEVVAMIGDGVNDAPSLKEADVGVAMGVTGTDVAREVADIILLDDSFASIVRGIEAGRAIFDNIKKFVTYVFAHNWAELIPFLAFITFNIPLPLTVTQVLAIDLGIDVLPSVALSREPPEEGVMDEPPKSKSERLFDRKVILRSFIIGLIASTLALYNCIRAWHEGGWALGATLDPSSPVYLRGVTMTFTGIVLAQMGNLLVSRKKKGFPIDASLLRNKWIALSLLAQLSILLAIVYIPPLQWIFETYPLTLRDLLGLAYIPLVVIAADCILRRLGL
ncbi:cation-transporting P-type ATPase [Infirmifilum lucidum]|uniref:Cation-transporting P-type ATPase n=1 Tax=Infirmifilum lucidum TaxID=2776706 RepID=A0A7L9FI81_9CREN|nr:cation-transporting P-type ATPase [Infirmifilum lucidum]QOJ79072.1 cation-transporting P-type ATPase [Infirmifilum lucidum]